MNVPATAFGLLALLSAKKWRSPGRTACLTPDDILLRQGMLRQATAQCGGQDLRQKAHTTVGNSAQW